MNTLLEKIVSFQGRKSDNINKAIWIWGRMTMSYKLDEFRQGKGRMGTLWIPGFEIPLESVSIERLIPKMVFNEDVNGMLLK